MIFAKKKKINRQFFTKEYISKMSR